MPLNALNDILLDMFKFLDANEVEKCQLVKNLWHYLILSTHVKELPLRKFTKLRLWTNRRVLRNLDVHKLEQPEFEIFEKDQVHQLLLDDMSRIMSLQKVVFEKLNIKMSRADQYADDGPTEKVLELFRNLMETCGQKVRVMKFVGGIHLQHLSAIPMYNTLFQHYVQAEHADLFINGPENTDLSQEQLVFDFGSTPPQTRLIPTIMLSTFDLSVNFFECVKFMNPEKFSFEQEYRIISADVEEFFEDVQELCVDLLRVFIKVEEPEKVLNKMITTFDPPFCFVADLPEAEYSKAMWNGFKAVVMAIKNRRPEFLIAQKLSFGNVESPELLLERTDGWKMRIFMEKIINIYSEHVPSLREAIGDYNKLIVKVFP